MASIITRTATAASKLQGIPKSNTATEDKTAPVPSLTHGSGGQSSIRSSSPDSLSQVERKQNNNTHQRFVLADPVAFRYEYF